VLLLQCDAALGGRGTILDMKIDRKTEILRSAIELIADEGYGSLSMRALARASGMKLGALQYHFRTWDALLIALVEYIEAEIISAFDASEGSAQESSIRNLIEFMLDEHVGTSDNLFSDRLWAQLWAMEQVEPLVSDLLEEVYAKFLMKLEKLMAKQSVVNARAEALMLLSLVEGESLFVGQGRRWEKSRSAVRKTILSLVDERYPGA
jgi:AcrR family transcriptional regulator